MYNTVQRRRFGHLQKFCFGKPFKLVMIIGKIFIKSKIKHTDHLYIVQDFLTFLGFTG